MKNKILMLVLIAFTIPTIQSCKKYPDGPGFSLRSRTERVSNTWKVDNYKINNSDFTSFMAGYTETYSKSGNYFFEWGVVEGSGNWTFQNDDKEIRLNGVSHKSSETLYILKLEEDAFWYYYMDGNDKYEVHLISN